VRTALGIGAHQKPLLQLEPVGPRTPTTLAEQTYVPSGWDAVGEFLAANEAMGRVGAALADGTAGRPEAPGAKMKTAMQDVMARLQRLAHTVGVDLRETR